MKGGVRSGLWYAPQPNTERVVYQPRPEQADVTQERFGRFRTPTQSLKMERHSLVWVLTNLRHLLRWQTETEFRDLVTL